MTGIERIAAVFSRAKREARCVLIPYLMAGDPDRETTATMLSALASAGADLIELGVPYGDPLADGPTIAAAAQRGDAHRAAKFWRQLVGELPAGSRERKSLQERLDALP